MKLRAAAVRLAAVATQQAIHVAAIAEVRRRRFVTDLREEKIRGFQTMYYTILPMFGLYLAFAADGQPEPTAVSLGHPIYEAWVAMNVICPFMALIGRRIYTRAARKRPGEKNYALTAAWAQFWGDAGVWGAILIYFACFVDTFYWGKPLYVTAFYLMGIPGGFMFTLMAWLRIRDIQTLDRLRRERLNRR